jgi:hypothetical protein
VNIDLSNTFIGVSSKGGRVRWTISTPFCGKAVVIARSFGPPGRGSFVMFSARAVSGAKVNAPAVLRKHRRVDRFETGNRLSTSDLQLKWAEVVTSPPAVFLRILALLV